MPQQHNNPDPYLTYDLLFDLITAASLLVLFYLGFYLVSLTQLGSLLLGVAVFTHILSTLISYTFTLFKPEHARNLHNYFITNNRVAFILLSTIKDYLKSHRGSQLSWSLDSQNPSYIKKLIYPNYQQIRHKAHPSKKHTTYFRAHLYVTRCFLAIKTVLVISAILSVMIQPSTALSLISSIMIGFYLVLGSTLLLGLAFIGLKVFDIFQTQQHHMENIRLGSRRIPSQNENTFNKVNSNDDLEEKKEDANNLSP